MSKTILLFRSMLVYTTVTITYVPSHHEWSLEISLSDRMTYFKYHLLVVGRQESCRYNGAQAWIYISFTDSWIVSSRSIYSGDSFFSTLTEWSSIKNSKNSWRLWAGPNRKVCENQRSVQWPGWRRSGGHPAVPGPSFQHNATQGGRSRGNPVGE